MKINTWTFGLAVLGLIHLPATTHAEENMNPLWTALSSTTISGYVNTSMHWNPGTGNGAVPSYVYNAQNKQDGFNLNVVDLTIEKALDEAQWAAGYKVQLWFGPDASTFASTLNGDGSSSSAAIKQAYVSLRTPVGNGLDFKIGVFDGLLGYESHDAGRNPNYTRAYGLALTPHTHTGVSMSYQFCPLASASVAVANTVGPAINSRANPPQAESFKTYTGLLAITAPDSWGFIGGSAFYGGVLNGYNNAANWNQTTWYAGATLNTPLDALKVGASYAYMGTTDSNLGNDDYANALALYASFQLTENLSLHGRGEYVWTGSNIYGQAAPIENGNSEIFSLTGTLQYDLWKNVISRLEVRWDHLCGDGQMTQFGGNPFVGGGGGGTLGDKVNSILIAANIIYQF